MEDRELDALLLQARPSASEEATASARELASDIASGGRSGAGSRRCRWRRTVIVPLGIGALALAGAGTVTAYQLNVPPFQGLEPGLERTTHGVPFEYRTDAGTHVACQAFVEFRDVTDLQRKQINAMSTDTDWSGYGQQMYNALTLKQRSVQNGPGPTGDAVLADLDQRALRAAPGTTMHVDHGPTITGGAISCSYPDGAPHGGK